MALRGRQPGPLPCTNGAVRPVAIATAAGAINRAPAARGPPMRSSRLPWVAPEAHRSALNHLRGDDGGQRTRLRAAAFCAGAAVAWGSRAAGLCQLCLYYFWEVKLATPAW